jgi:hypothetical protein
MLLLVGAGQVAHQELDGEALQAVGGGGEGLELVQGQAEAVHAGVEVQGGGEAPPVGDLRAGVGGEGLDLGGAAQHRDQPRGVKARRGAGDGAVEHQDAGVAPRPQFGAQGLAFLQPGDEEGAGALGPQAAGDGAGAEAIAVGLDHRGDLGRTGQAPEHGVVGGEGVEVDREAGAGGRHVARA